MRVFIGIKASRPLQKKIAQWQEENKSLPARFIKPENLHLTLVPPWYENNINRLIKHLKKFRTEIEPFKIGFDRITTGPPGKPRLIWTAGPAVPELVKLNNELLMHFKKRKEKRGFKTHITIARFGKKNLNNIPEVYESVKWEMTASEIILFESILNPKGAEYELIESRKI